MKVLFADTGYWIAIFNRRDELHAKALEMSIALGRARIVTSEMVLTEFLNYFGGHGKILRKRAAEFVGKVMENRTIAVEPQTSRLFRKALSKYAGREDKSWSLTDCASFIIMDEI